jgi:hypothetical protein
MGEEAAILERDKLLYDAEVAAGTFYLRPLLSVEEAQTYVNGILRREWWARMGGRGIVTVRYVPQDVTCGMDKTGRGTFEMTLGMGNLCMGSANHELAHGSAWNECDVKEIHHGPQYIRCLLEIVGRTQHRLFYRRLQEELKLRGFRWRKPWIEMNGAT